MFLILIEVAAPWSELLGYVKTFHLLFVNLVKYN